MNKKLKSVVPVNCRLWFIFVCLMFFGPPAYAQLLTGYDVEERKPQQPEPEKTIGAPIELRRFLPPPVEAPLTVVSPPQLPQETAPAYSAARKLTGYFGAAPVLKTPEETKSKAVKSTPKKKPLARTAPELSASSDPVDIVADNMGYNEAERIMEANGDVIIQQSGRILRADKVTYNIAADTVRATGNVVLNEANGDIYYSDDIQLTDEMKNGTVKKLQSYLSDGSYFSAREGERNDGTKTTMYGAAYTPCPICDGDESKTPVWQIRSAAMTHDEVENRISYKHARFEVYGVPVMYTPYFSHPDGTIKQKSGFLAPSLGYQSELGTFVDNSYYWGIAPDKDATLGVRLMTEENPMVFGQWRQAWNSAWIVLNGSGTYSQRTAREGDRDIREDEEARGHVFGKGLWSINEKLRAGLNIEYASDDQYLRQYDFTSKNVLESDIYLERFSGRDYAVARLLRFQDVRVREEQEDQPDVLPEIVARFVGEPGGVPLLKGRWSLSGSFLGLQRNGDEQDMNRFSLEAGWRRRMVSDFGLVTALDASARSDVYNTRDRAVATPGSGRSTEATEVRLYPQITGKVSYPVVQSFERYQVMIEPVVTGTLAPNIDVNDDIPNEDSRDVQIDASNIFEPNRFPGLDRVEDKSHITYGVRSGLYGYGGSHLDAFLGQSYRLDDDDNPFPEGSGLNNQGSDVVGEINGIYGDVYDLNYRFQLDSHNLSSQRHEVAAYANWDRLTLGTRYLFAKGLAGTEIDESREQIDGALGYYLTEDWRVRTGATRDLGETPGLRKAYFGIDFFGDCVSWSLTGQRNLTDDASGDSDTEILFRIGLKNLGEFERSGYSSFQKSGNFLSCGQP